MERATVETVRAGPRASKARIRSRLRLARTRQVRQSVGWGRGAELLFTLCKLCLIARCQHFANYESLRRRWNRFDGRRWRDRPAVARGENSRPTYQMSAVLASGGIAHHLDDWRAPKGGHDAPVHSLQSVHSRMHSKEIRTVHTLQTVSYRPMSTFCKL